MLHFELTSRSKPRPLNSPTPANLSLDLGPQGLPNQLERRFTEIGDVHAIGRRQNADDLVARFNIDEASDHADETTNAISVGVRAGGSRALGDQHERSAAIERGPKHDDAMCVSLTGRISANGELSHRLAGAGPKTAELNLIPPPVEGPGCHVSFVIWEDNPNGAIVNWHPRVSCDVFSGQTP